MRFSLVLSSWYISFSLSLPLHTHTHTHTRMLNLLAQNDPGSVQHLYYNTNCLVGMDKMGTQEQSSVKNKVLSSSYSSSYCQISKDMEKFLIYRRGAFSIALCISEAKMAIPMVTVAASIAHARQVSIYSEDIMEYLLLCIAKRVAYLHF